tara:strand:+ start:286 stop:981 length:696 start_codon:yes stop_codon:yes gene_type:complete
MKIAVLMWYDGGFESYGDNCYKINKVYCDKYGYDLIKSSEKFYKTRSGHWERYPFILKHIKDYDYIVWVDADAFFYNTSPPITDLIKKHKKEIIFGKDDCEINPPAINTGVAIFKNTERVVNILKKWAYSNELKDKYCGFVITDGYLCPKLNWIEDQALVRGFYQDDVDNVNSISEIVPYLELQHYNTEEREILCKLKSLPYIFHLAGRHEMRYTESKTYLDLLRKLGHDI